MADASGDGVVDYVEFARRFRPGRRQYDWRRHLSTQLRIAEADGHTADSTFGAWVQTAGDDMLSVADLHAGLQRMGAQVTLAEVQTLLGEASTAVTPAWGTATHSHLDLPRFRQLWTHVTGTTALASAGRGSRATGRSAWSASGNAAGGADVEVAVGTDVAAERREAAQRAELLRRLIAATAHHRVAVAGGSSSASAGAQGAGSRRGSRGSAREAWGGPGSSWAAHSSGAAGIVVPTAVSLVREVERRLQAQGGGGRGVAGGSDGGGVQACFAAVKDAMRVARVTKADVFGVLDADQDGFLGAREWLRGMQAAGSGSPLGQLGLESQLHGRFTSSQLRGMHAAMDPRGRGFADYTAFSSAVGRGDAGASGAAHGGGWEEEVFSRVRAWASEFDGDRAGAAVHRAPASSDDVSGVRAVYQLCDVNNVGALRSFTDVQRGFAAIGVKLTAAQAERVFGLMDARRNGAVQFDDFKRRCEPRPVAGNWMELTLAAVRERLAHEFRSEADAFSALADGAAGGVTCDGFVAAMRGGARLPRHLELNCTQWAHLFQGLDTDADGVVSKAEFGAAFSSAWTGGGALARAVVDTYGGLEQAFDAHNP